MAHRNGPPKLTKRERERRASRNDRRGRTSAFRLAKQWEAAQRELRRRREAEQRAKRKRFW